MSDSRTTRVLSHWRTDGATPEEARLLDHARRGGPSQASRARIAAAIGVAVGSGGAILGTSTVAKASPLSAKVLAVKFLVAIAVGGAAGATAWQVVRTDATSAPPSRTAEQAPAATAAVPASSGARVAVPSLPEPPSAPEIPGAVDDPTKSGGAARSANGDLADPTKSGAARGGTIAIADATRERATTQAAAPAPPSADESSGNGRPRESNDIDPPKAGDAPLRANIDDELRLLENAKSSLNRHRPDAALATLGEYDRAHPRGVLAVEASVIRIEALMAAGRTEDAKARAEAFLRASPGAVQAARVRSLLQKLPAPAPQ